MKNMKTRLTLIALAAGLLAGCATGPATQSPDVPAPTTWSLPHDAQHRTGRRSRTSDVP